MNGPAFRRAFLLLNAALLLFFPKKIAAQTEPVWSDTLIAQTLIQEARQLHLDANHEIVLKKSAEALEIYTRLYGDTDLKTVLARLFVGRAYRNLNREQEALPLFEQSLPALKAAGNIFLLARCHQNIGLCLANTYQYASAHQHLQTAIELLRPDSVAQATVIADMNIGEGSVLNFEKNYRAAIPVLEKAKAVYALHADSNGLGFASYHLGGAWFGLHDYTRAKEQYLTAVANLKNILKPAHSYFADLYVKIGLCCQKTGEPELGLRHLLEAKAAYLKARTEDLNYIQFMKYLGEFYLDEQQYPAAIEQLELCLAAKEKRFGNQSFHLLSTIQVLGEACLQDGQFNRAEICFRRGLQIMGTSTQHAHQLKYRFYSKLAEIRLLQGDPAACILRCDSAFVIAGFDPDFPEKMLPRDYFRELCQLYARALFEQSKQKTDTVLMARAEQYFALAAKTLFREVEEITVNSSREIFYDRDHLLLEQWLDARMALFHATGNIGQAEAAFQIAGQSKAFLLSEAMRQSGALRYAGAPDSILQAELNLREQIATAEKQLHTSGFPMDSAVLALNRQLTGWRKNYDELLRQIETQYPDYFHLRVQQPDVTTDALRRKWLAPGQALLMYSLTNTHLYTFVLSRDTFCSLSQTIRPELLADLESFRKCLTAYHTAADPDDALYDQNLDTFIALAQSLYRELVLPVAALLPDRVLLIPDGKLWYLPFEALLTGAPADAGNFNTYPFWACKKAVSYCLSTDFVVRTGQSPARLAQKNWLGVAAFAKNSAATNNDTRVGSGRPFMPLPFSGREVQAIAALLHGDVWLGAAARPGRFEREAFKYRILHLATHSRADDRLGDYSFVAVSDIGEPMPAKTLYQLALAAEMVVLSACEAGSGQLLRGEGIIGMVRAFTYAGAQSVVASLWVANDQSTAGLMVAFYRNLRKGMAKDQAIQAARAHLFQEFPAQSHPFYWAGFRVYGSVGALWP